MLREISLFLQENSVTIAFLFVAVLLLLIALIRQWYKDHKNLSTELNKAHAERSRLFEVNHAYNHLMRAVVAAMRGAKRNYSSTPDYVFTEFLHLGDGDRDEWQKYLVPENLSIDGYELLRKLQIPAALYSLEVLLVDAKKSVVDGYYYYDNNCEKTRDVSKLAEDYRGFVSSLIRGLAEFLPGANTSQLEASLLGLMESIEKEGHVNEAKYLLRNLYLGTPGLEPRSAQKFLAHCRAGDTDPKDLIPANLHKCWDMVATAIATLDAAVITSEAVTEVASRE
jgi:hypothetical protein